MKQNYFSSAFTCKNFTKNSYKCIFSSIIGEKGSNSMSKIWMLPALLMITLLFGNYSYAQTVVTTSSTGTYTWTAPCDVSSITVEVWGAGGGGAGATGNPAAGGGGSGGGYIKTVYTVTPGTTYNLYAGIAGTGGTTGTDGEASWFNTNAIIKAIGGKGAGAAISTNTYGSGAVAYSTGNLTSGTVAFNTYGGSGSNATSTYSGAGGSSAGSTASGNGTTSTGGIAPTNGYAGANGITAAATDGSVGGIGAGGSGGRATSGADKNGGAGGRGQVKITYTSAYCSPTFTGVVEPITNVTFAGINNTTSAVLGGTPSFESICLTGTVVQGSSTNAISLKGNTNGAYNDYFTVYIDWNQNGVLNDAGETYAIGLINNSTGVDAKVVTGNITVPGSASLGTTRMRVVKKYNVTSAGPCESGAFDGQTEDYNLTVTVPPVPTITSLGSASGCPGSSITINGTNLTGATAADVKIGGTAVSSITSNSGTVLVAVVGAGTTGTVAVTTAGGTGTSAGTYTVTATPAAIGGGAATGCTGATTPAFTNAVGGGTWSITNGTGSATISAGGVVTGVTVGTVTVVYTIGTCSSSTGLTIGATPAITTNPANVSINAGTNTSFTTVATNTPTSYTWEVSTDGGTVWSTVANGGVYTNATTATLNLTGVPYSMNGYKYRVKATNACGASANSTVATLTVTLVYCTAGGSSAASSYVSNVSLNTINQSNVTWGGYRDYFPTVSTSVMATVSYSMSVTIYNATVSQKNISAWIDWNNNGLFDIATETVLSTTSTVASAQSVTLTNIFTVPVGAVINPTRLRVELAFNTEGAAAPCNVFSLTDVQDYKVNVIGSVVCATPTAQPTTLVLTPAGTTIGGSFTAASPVADNYLVLINTTGVAPAPVNGTTYSVGSTIGSSTVADIDSNTTFTATGLSGLTTYYIYVFSYNSACTGGPLYYTASPLNGSTTTLAPTYCAPTGNLNCTVNDYISNVTLNTLNNTTTCGAGGYTNYAATGAQTTALMKGSTYTFSLSVGAGTGTHGAGVWVDFNRNGSFADAGEFFLVSNTIAASSTTSISIPIPIGAVVGDVRMRVRYAYSITVMSGAGMSCTMAGTYGETEDYTITLIAPLACVAPTAQPTVMSLTPSGDTIAGSFTAASPIADNYLVVISTSATPPTPVNGTTYSIGGTVGAGYTVIDTDSNTSFSANGLTILTTYYVYVFSFNSLCSGGPLYLGTSPLNGTTTTLSAVYCTPTIHATYQTSTNYHIRKVEFIGTLQDITNTSSFPTGAPFGYENHTGLAVKSIQAKGEGVNIYMESPFSGFIKAWVDWNIDGDFADAGETVYDSGNVSQASTTLGFIVPTGIAAGDYRVRLRISGRNGAGSDAGYSWNSCTTNLVYYGETEDYILRVIENCAAKISTITNGSVCGTGVVNLQATATVGTTEFRWYSALTGGSLLATTATGSWNTPSISTTTVYYVTAYNGSCETLVRTKITAFVKSVPTLSFATSNTEICGENSVVALTASGDNEIIYLLDENFEGGMGTFSNVHYVSNAAVNASDAWQIKTSTYIPTGTTWFPAISSNFGANNFAFVNSDIGTYTGPPASTTYYYVVDNGLVSNTVSSMGFLDLTFKFRMYFDRYYPDTVNPANELMTVDVSTNGGTSWTAVSGNIINDIGYGTRFTQYSYNLSAYINQANLKVRIRYYTDTWANGAAVDNIELYGTKPLNTALNWVGTPLPDVYTDAPCTIPYTAGTPATIVYVKPALSQLVNGSYTFTASATLTNGCSVSQDITITNKTSIWKGTTNGDWNNPNNWSPVGVPTISTCVIIPDVTATNASSIIGTNYNAFGKSLIVKNLGRLEIQPTNSLTIADDVNVITGGTFNIKNSASLVQINSIANTGLVNMERISQPMYLYDYTYWGSPHTTASGFTLGNLSSGSSQKYTWTPSVGGVSGNWIYAAAGTVMTPGKGFIVKAPDTYSSNPATKVNFTANFIGTPNNGDVTTPITYGTMGAGATDDKWNLISNPYPSAVSANSFLNLASNVPLIDGTIYFWTHNSPPSAAYPDPFYGDFAVNYTATDYASWNKLGGTGTQAITFGPTPSGYIAAGEAFFVKSLGVAGNATFNNSMRVTNNNSQFFRSANPTTTADIDGNDDVEKHRIWLNLTNNSGAFSQILVGYAQGATTGMDRDFDGTRFGGNAVTFYSILPEANLGIQGRPLPFNDNDQVTLGFNAAASGSYSVRIDHIDGLFDVQDIYLEDKMLNVIHNIKTAPYVFTTAAGNFNNRFVLRYTTTTLGTDTVDFDNTVKVTVNEKVTVHSSNQPIKNIVVYDMLGRKIDSYKNVDSTQFTLNHLNKTMNVLILKITLDNDVIVTQKISY